MCIACDLVGAYRLSASRSTSLPFRLGEAIVLQDAHQCDSNASGSHAARLSQLIRTPLRPAFQDSMQAWIRSACRSFGCAARLVVSLPSLKHSKVYKARSDPEPTNANQSLPHNRKATKNAILDWQP